MTHSSTVPSKINSKQFSDQSSGSTTSTRGKDKWNSSKQVILIQTKGLTLVTNSMSSSSVLILSLNNFSSITKPFQDTSIFSLSMLK